ncbi:MAG: serine hydrolase domain-containing protein [Bacteroidota bacterium]
MNNAPICTYLCSLLWTFCLPYMLYAQQKTFAPSPSAKADDKIAAIDQLVKSLVDDQFTVGVTWGIQIGLSTVHTASYGHSDLESQTPVNKNTRFHIASVTKPFTAIAIALLIEQGQVSLDQKLSDYFPKFPKGDQVSIYQLLSHTSGIPDWWVGQLPDATPDDWLTRAHPHQYLSQMKQIYLFESGTQYSYSNSGYLLLGEIIEQVVGISYSEFIQKYIVGPLDLSHTGILAEGENTNLAKGYGVKQDTSGISPTFIHQDFFAGGLKSVGGLTTTAIDLLKWTKALFSEKYVTEKMLNQMTKYAKVNSGQPTHEALYWPADWPVQNPPVFMKKAGYGLGFTLTEMYGEPVIWHSGGLPGFNAIWVYIPSSQTTLVILANTDNGAVPVFESIMKMITD